MKKLLILCMLMTTISSCGQKDNKLNKLIVTQSQNLFNGILDNDYELFYDNYTKEMFRFSGLAQSYGKGISSMSKAQKIEMLAYLHNKLKKTMKNNIKLKNIAYSVASLSDKESGGAITLIYGNDAENYEFHYLTYRMYNGKFSIALGNDDFNKVNLNEILKTYTSRISFKGIESEIFIENLN